ncbi:tumor necrosis factor ligand superfamily member 13B-like [Hemiscyllium ocellatum]|uniref:tumor necrosis factor ligand superfamily member 13B-like n=1 Tax=Hemiscyllium ocellatum TaxID=170820 RepID=UPI00296654D6|nr:tumor necrosis factor ligand superfamily member 13B-like [Hemiscyllium ocellatum]
MNAVQQKAGFDMQHRCLVFSACVLTSAALLSTYVAAVALHHVLALRAEISSMREELESYKFRLDHLAKGTRGQAANWSSAASRLGEVLTGERRGGETGRGGEAKPRSRRSLPEPARRSFVQLIATNDQRPVLRASNCQKCLPGRHQQVCRAERRPVSSQNRVEGTLVPWMLSLKKGTALDRMDNKISVKEAGFFLIYSQVWYKDNIFTMGHFIKRVKANIVGSEPRTSILFRCVQNMPACCPNNSCFTAGVAKLEAGDELELVIPRVQAHVALNGDGTFFGAIQLP